MPTTISSPQGLSLSPTPPKPTRVSKRAMMALGGVFAFLLLVIFVGAYKRTKAQQQSTAANQDANAGSALPAVKNLKRELADTAAKSPDLNAPPHYGSKPSSEKPEVSAQGLTPPPLQPTPDLNTVPALPTTAGASGANAYREETAEEKRRLLAYQKEREAMNAPTLVQTTPGSSNSSSRPGGLPSAMPGGVSDLLSSALARQNALASNPKAVQDAIANVLRPNQDQNADSAQQSATEKEQFLARARTRTEESYLKSTRISQLSLYEIKAGWDIPAILEQALNSDLPGEIRAMVRSDVYDSASGKYLLIPQGARLVGSYNSNVSYGQQGLQVVWTRLIFPDGSSITLDGMNGQDEKGYSGFRYDVDHHYRRLLATALLTSAFAAGLQLSQNTGQQSVLTTPSASQVAAQATGQQITQLGIDLTRKNLSVAPTIKIPIGYRFNVRVNRDMLLDRPYIRHISQDYREINETQP